MVAVPARVKRRCAPATVPAPSLQRTVRVPALAARKRALSVPARRRLALAVLPSAVARALTEEAASGGGVGSGFVQPSTSPQAGAAATRTAGLATPPTR